MKKTKHENIYLHIKRSDWFIGWRVFWGLVISFCYWKLIVFMMDNNSLYNREIFAFAIASFIMYGAIIMCYHIWCDSVYARKFGKW